MTLLGAMRQMVAAGCMAGCLAAAALAGGVAGQDDPRFVAAVDLWLADDEVTALPGLAALAAEGNRAAQILLAIIDQTPAYQGPYLARLPRDQRIALMRAPQGMSGQSWMRAAADDTPLARLWVEWQRPTSDAATAMALAEMGEQRAASLALQALSQRQYRDFDAVADDPDYPDGMRYLIWFEWKREGGAGRLRAEAEVAARMPGDPQAGRFSSREVPPEERDAWLVTTSLAEPLRAFCSAVCPESAAACVRATLAMVGCEAAYDEGALARFGTPAEVLIPSEAWMASRRGQLALLRPVSARSGLADRLFALVNAEDACVGRALAAETARFYR